MSAPHHTCDLLECAIVRRQRDELRSAQRYLVEENARLWAQLAALRDEGDVALRAQRDQLLRLVVDSGDSPASEV